MENYTQINPGQSGDTIVVHLRDQIESHPETREIRYEKVPKTEHMYSANIHDSNQFHPAVNPSNLVGTASIRNLQRVLAGKVKALGLPQTIRIVKPSQELDFWGIFFTQ